MFVCLCWCACLFVVVVVPPRLIVCSDLVACMCHCGGWEDACMSFSPWAVSELRVGLEIEGLEIEWSRNWRSRNGGSRN